jgi:hypothetical protein
MAVEPGEIAIQLCTHRMAARSDGQTAVGCCASWQALDWDRAQLLDFVIGRA